MEGRAHLIDLLVVQLAAVGDVLPADGVVHIGLDATGSDSVDSNLLVTKVWLYEISYPSVTVTEARAAGYLPTAMHRTKVSMAPLLPL
jgi:hypothetical protein